MVYILLPVHNRLYKTVEFIENLLAQSIQEFHLLLIDDGSTDKTEERVVKMLGERVTTIKGKGNWWWGGSLEKGYRWLLRTPKVNDKDIILIMNNDTSFDPSFLETGMRLIVNNPRSLITANAYNNNLKELVDQGVTINWSTFDFKLSNSRNTINCLSTRGLILEWLSFKEIGGFHPFLLPHYFSDYEFTCRAHAKGFKLLTDDTFRLYLDETTTGTNIVMEKGKIARIREVFSKRYKANPLYRIVFIFLATPKGYSKLKLIRLELTYMLRFFYSLCLSAKK